MTKDQKLEAIRAKCIAANPQEKPWMSESERVWDDAVRPVRLADVLLAIPIAAVTLQLWPDRLWITYTDPGHDGAAHDGAWELTKDDLSLQSQETIDFIHSLLS
jgi:hypothetical protein